MSSAITVSYADSAPPSTGLVTGALMYGDNGPANGPDPELTVDNGYTAVSGRETWNPNYNSDGSWDSGWILVSMAIHSGGGTNGIVFGDAADTMLDYSGEEYGDITSISLVSATQINGSVTWGDVNITFLSGDTTVDSYNSDSPAQVDTTTAADPSEVSVTTVSTSAEADSALITGQVRFTTPPGTYPAPTDLYAAIMMNSLTGGPTS